MKSVVMERQMAHPPEKIWRALTEGPLIQEWLMANDFEPVVGHRFTFRATPMPGWDGIIEAEVLLVEPVTKLSYTWGSMGVATLVEWILTATDNGTLVRMEQSGFGDDQDQNYKGAMYGWQRFIGNLEKVLNEL